MGRHYFSHRDGIYFLSRTGEERRKRRIEENLRSEKEMGGQWFRLGKKEKRIGKKRKEKNQEEN